MANISSYYRIIALAAGTASAFAATPAAAGNTTGTIGVTLNVTNACVVNGATALQANAGQMGTIAFPDQPGIFGNVDGELVGSLGQLQVQCSPGVTPSLTIGSGANDTSGRRHMIANGRTVAYRLFSDAQRTSEIGIGQQLALATAGSTPISVPIYARVTSGGTLLAAGSYADTVQVTLTW
ncbi:spore coat protein U domain-containing protein [Roseomonas aeriglobus]|nr:spore coat protein U domain-containing protein [Roseomonas aeriglobus]